MELALLDEVEQVFFHLARNKQKQIGRKTFFCNNLIFWLLTKILLTNYIESLNLDIIFYKTCRENIMEWYCINDKKIQKVKESFKRILSPKS